SFTTTEMGIPFANYMTTRVDPYFKDAKEDVKKAVSLLRGEAKVIAEWEPTPVFTNSKRDAYMIARATKADPSHAPASLDEVKEKVIQDVKLAAANEKAKQAAQAVLDAAKTPKWLYTVADDQGKKAFTTGLFTPAEGGMGALMVPGYELKGAAVTEF